MSRDVLTVGSTMRIPLLYRGEYSQWVERFMNYLEEQTDGEAMINSIKNGDQPLPRVTQVSIAGTSSTEQPPLKDKSMWFDQEKKIQKIDRPARSLLIQGLLNDIYSLIDSNKTAKDLWDALAKHMLGSEYGEQDRKATKCGYSKDNCELNFKFLNNLQQEWKQYATMMRQNKNLMDINIDALYNILKQNQGDFNDAMGLKKKTIMVTSDPLALLVEKTKVSKSKEKVVVSSDSEGSDADDLGELKKITALLAKAFNRRKFYSKPTNNNLRTSSTSQSANKKQEFVKKDEKKVKKKDDEKKRDMSKVKCYNCKKEGHFAKYCKKANVKDYNYYKTKMLLAKKDSDKQVLLAEDQVWMESSSDSDQEINANMVFMAQIEKVLSDSETSSSSAYGKISEVKRYEYMIRYSAYFDIDKQHRKQIADQEVLYDKMSVQLVELDKHVRDPKNTALEKDFKISKLEECVCNKDPEIEKCLERLNVCENKLHKMSQINQIVHMIMPSKDTLYNGQKGIGFENSIYFEKAKDLRPSLYDEKVIALGYTTMFLTYSDEALEIEKFKRARENKIKFAYDYGSLNASYQTSSLKPYVSTVILEKIIIDLKDEVVSLLEKEKENLKIIESLKSNDVETSVQSSEKVVSETENQSENDCQVVEKECDQVENSKVIAPGMFKLSVSQSVSPISVTKTSCASNSVENKTKRKRNLDTFNSVRRPKHSGVIWDKKRSSNTSNVDLSLLCDSFDENNLFIFDDESVRISPVIKMPFRKKPRDSMNIVQICLWIIDSGCSKHMTGNRALLTNFVKKFLGTVRFGNNDFAVISGYGDVVIGSMKIKKVYYVEGIGHNLFSVGQFYDKGLEVAFRKSTCFVRNEDGVDLLTGDHSLNLYTTALNEVASNSSTCLLAKASSSQSWLWRQRLLHLNFTTINNLVKNNLVQGLPKMKFKKDHLCSAWE
nr:integrase, catalytic region, zinc finger, CCHC-type, peptidase aspartic, catalytic [Tanacetum cinerariifolium]